MVWIYARRVLAQMVKGISFRNNAMRHFISEPMGRNSPFPHIAINSTEYIKGSVLVGSDMPKPNPTWAKDMFRRGAVNIDEFPKPLFIVHAPILSRPTV